MWILEILRIFEISWKPLNFYAGGHSKSIFCRAAAQNQRVLKKMVRSTLPQQEKSCFFQKSRWEYFSKVLVEIMSIKFHNQSFLYISVDQECFILLKSGFKIENEVWKCGEWTASEFHVRMFKISKKFGSIFDMEK